MNSPRRFAVLVVVMVSVISPIALTGGALAGKGGSYSGSISASPNPATRSQSVTLTCSWNAYQKSGIYARTVYCYLDGVLLYSNNIASGSYSTTYAAGSLSAGSHILEVDYSTGGSKCGSTYCYTYAKKTTTLTVTCATQSITLTFYIFDGLTRTLSFWGGWYTNGQYQTVQGGCSQHYAVSPGSITPYNFFEWATDTDGLFASTGKSYSNSASDTFIAGARSGSIMMILDDWSSVASLWAGYVQWSPTNSVTSTSAWFQIPTSISYYPFGNPPLTPDTDYLSISVGFGDYWIPATAFFGAGVAMSVDHSGNVMIVPYFVWCDAANPPNCHPSDYWPYTASPGDWMYVGISTSPGPYSSCLIQDQGPTRGGSKWIVSSSSNPPCMVSGFSPDRSTQEWIAEIPPGTMLPLWGTPGPFAGPNISPIIWQGVSWVGPLVNEEAVYNHCPQNLNAGDVSSTAAGQFTITYTNLGSC